MMARDQDTLQAPARAGRRAGLIALLVMLPLAAQAVTPGEKLADPTLESRAREITGELRCLVCQNQSVDDSDAPLAKDLRVLVREQLQLGKSDAEVKAFVHARYGDFVLLRPPLRIGTLLLWTAPALALIAGAAAVWAAMRRRGSTPPAPAALTGEERETLRRLGIDAGDEG